MTPTKTNEDAIAAEKKKDNTEKNVAKGMMERRLPG